MKFKALISLALVFVLFCLCSCEQTLEAPKFSKVNILVYGNDYANNPKGKIGNATGTASSLLGTINDATQVGLALEALAEKSGIECSATYVTGKNYTIKGRYRTKISYVPEEKSDHDTTKAHFRELMGHLAESSTANELTIIFFSCHGFNMGKDVKQSYTGNSNSSKTSFVMSGTSSSDTFELYTHKEFKEDLAAIKGTKVVFADVCYSGGLVDPTNVAINTDEYTGTEEIALYWGDYTLTKDPSTFFLTASRYYEQSYETDTREHGVFTVLLLDALGWDEENQQITKTSGTITFFDLCQDVATNNKYSTLNPQTPMLTSGSNDVILFDLN